ncbi:MAG: HAMP domain-containing protein, partial [Variovorax sp.]|nr:HAMP domain-containing protein [Variovorax sp.]
MSAGLLVAQLAGSLIQSWDRQRTLGHTVSHELAQRIAAVYRVVDAQTGPQRQPMATLLSTPSLQIHIVDRAPLPTVTAPSMLDDLPGHITEVLGPRAEVRTTELPRQGRFAFKLHLRLSSGEWLRLNGSAPEGVFALPWNLLFNLGLMLVAVVLLVAMAASSTVRPLTELAKAAHSLSRDLRSPPVPENGPTEVREAAQAFNAMQSRIRSGIEERERFLAAVSHDLKTPLTRMRLRTEMMADPQLRAQLQADTDDMLQLLDGTLDFLRGKAVEELLQRVDLVALVESLVEDYQGLGTVTLQAPDALQWSCRPKALKRALTNLIDDALK